MTFSLETSSLPAIAERDRLEERSLEELLKRRIAVENHFARLGHTYRHGRLYRNFEHRVTRPALKLGLRALGLYSRGLRNALSPVVKNISLSFANLPPEFDGFQILQLSDFHIEGTPGLAEALNSQLAGLRPDVCVLTGDYRFEDHGPTQAIYPLMRSVLSNIRSRFGIYGVLGNHDIAEIAFRLEDLGVRMLINEAVEIADGVASFWLLGVDDPFDYRCHDLDQALAPVPEGSFRVLLSHAPEIYREAAQAGIDLYLSGHTHGGQIRVPVWGALRQNAACPRAYAYGSWRHGNMQGYTSAGVGCSSLPVRFGCPPEIVLLELRRDVSAESERVGEPRK